MGFRFRLALILIVALVAVQALTALPVYRTTRHELIAAGGRELAATAAAFVQQLQDLSTRVADNVQVLSMDYALRGAIAQHDQATVLSVLRNHGRRVGAERMRLIDTDGTIEVDTTGTAPAGSHFEYAALLAQALEHASAAVVARNDKVYWTVVVPVFAPNLVGLIAADIPVDDALLERIGRQSAVQKEIELVTLTGGQWVIAARGGKESGRRVSLLGPGRDLPAEPEVVKVHGQEYVLSAQRLSAPEGGPEVAAVLGYSLDEALAPYRGVALTWASLLALGLGVGLLGALFIARRVSRPIEDLAVLAQRIGEGDYTPPPAPTRRDEIGQLQTAFSGMARAIGEREERIRHQAGHDAVTGLPNRTGGEAMIQPQLGGSGALLMVGLARLPEIIKTTGHALGDRLMRDASDRLRPIAVRGTLLRATDSHFAFWIPGIGADDALRLAARSLAVLGSPYQEADVAFDLVPAVGIALAPAHGTEATLLLQRAEVALFDALTTSDRVVVYDPATDPHRSERLSLMGDLREALDRDQLQLHYQPKLNLVAGTIDGAESLMRWHHARRGYVPPDSFIGLAEETGNIGRLTQWALATSIVQARRWGEQGRVLKVAVNVSPRDFEEPDLPERVDELLALHGVAPGQLILEVTEGAVMGEPDAAVEVMQRLASRGIELSIDDFGVGQSSFAYLRRLPVRELKIDKTFITTLAESAENRTIVRSIVELGHHLGYRVTAEGVEDAASLAYLASIGCDHAQGWHIAKALPASAFDAFLVTGGWCAPAAAVRS